LKMANCPTVRTRDLDLGLGHTAYRHASLVDLYLYIPSTETFCGRTYRRADGHLTPTLLGRLGVDLKRKTEKETEYSTAIE